MDPKTNTIIRDGRQSVANPFDTAALEVALVLKDELGGRVSVLSMGIPDTCRLLRDAIARGADDALLLSDRAFAGADTLATSYALSMGLDELGDADLVLCGKMAVDGDTAQIGPELGGILGVPCVWASPRCSRRATTAWSCGTTPMRAPRWSRCRCRPCSP